MTQNVNNHLWTYPLARVVAGGVNLLGTCFAVGPDLVATAHHVISGDPQGLVAAIPWISHVNEYQDTSRQDVQMVDARVVAADPVRDLAILALNGVSFSSPLVLGSTDDTSVGDSVTIEGYPHANFGRMVLTLQEAHVGARILLPSGGQKFKNIVLNTQAREGQSGGPVIDPRSRSVVAVLLGSYAPGGGGSISLGGVDPATLHQTTHAISAQYLKDML